MCASWSRAILSSTVPKIQNRSVAKLLPGEDETIVALSTARGRAGIAVVRLSGPSAFAFAKTMVHPWPLEPRTAALCRITDPADGSLIDQGIVTAFPAPRS